MTSVPVVTWSLVVASVSLLLAQTLRYILKRLLGKEVFKLVDEFLASFQNSVCILELGVVSSLYGFRSWVGITSIFIFSALKHFTFIRGKYFANPLGFIDSFYNAGKTCLHSPLFMILVVAIQILAAVAAHPFVKLLWGRSYSEFHNKILFSDCKTTLEVSFMHGFIVEILTTFVAWSTDYFTPVNKKPPIRSAVSLALALIFEGTSGVWMNPAVASAHTFNCTGHDNAWEHVITYWLGPFVAVILFYEMKELVHNLKNGKGTFNKKSTPCVEPYTTESTTNGTMLVDATPKRTREHDMTQDNKSADNSQNKYHRSPGGSLRPRNKSYIGHG